MKGLIKKERMFPEFLVWFCVLLLLVGIVLERYNGDLLLQTSLKKLIFCTKRLDFND